MYKVAVAGKSNTRNATVFGKIKRDFRVNRFCYLMFIPVIAYYLIFHYGAMFGVVVAFMDYNPFRGIRGSNWVGLRHFQAFLSDPLAHRAIRNTFILNVYQVLFFFPAPIILALLLNEIRINRYKRIVQTISYLPHFVSLVVICGIIMSFSRSTGLFSDIAALFGFERRNFLLAPELFRGIFVASDIWQGVGWGSIIYLAAITSVDMEQYESAVLDGANRFKQMLHVTLPGILPIISILLILRIGQMMTQGVEKIILLYSPLTYSTADVISSFVFRRGLLEANHSYATAVGLFNSVINLVLLTSANAISRKLSETSLW